MRAVNAWAGGTAYDPRYQTAWVSDGATLAEYFVVSGSLCRARCPSFRAVLSDPTAVVSGLTCSDARPRLFQLATRPGLLEMTIYDNSGRCPREPRQCRRELPAGAVAGGIAYDEINDLLFISISIPQPLGGYSNILTVTSASRPCDVRCETRFFRCSSRIVTGLGYDACSQRLFATDGQNTQTFTITNAGSCEFRPGDCCRKQHSPTYRGLAVLPCWESQSIGRPCLTRDCPSCPTMHADTSGDPAIGTNFTIQLNGAPSGGLASLIVDAGPCGPGVSLAPPLCGVLYPSLGSAISLAPVSIVGSLTCSGRASTQLPIAVDPRLCGQTYCVQWFIRCPRGGFGLSEAIEFTVTGG